MDIFDLYLAALSCPDDESQMLFNGIVHEANETLKTGSVLSRNAHAVYGSSLFHIAVISRTIPFLDSAIERLEIALENEAIEADKPFSSISSIKFEIAKAHLQKALMKRDQGLIADAINTIESCKAEQDFRGEFLRQMYCFLEASEGDFESEACIELSRWVYKTIEAIKDDSAEWKNACLDVGIVFSGCLIDSVDDSLEVTQLFEEAKQVLEKVIACFDLDFVSNDVILKLGEAFVNSGVVSETLEVDGYNESYDRACILFEKYKESGKQLPAQFKNFVSEYRNEE